MHFKAFITIVLAILCACSSISAQQASTLLKQADDFYDHGQFRAALQLYRQGGNSQTWDKDTRLRVAICLYEVNDIDESIVLLNQLMAEGKTEPLVFFYRGRAYQHQLQFEKAVEDYKEYLRRSKEKDKLRDWVKDEILRCASGKGIKFSEQMAFTENLGTSVNTLYDEFAPVPSPIYQDRIYFSSARTGSTGGLYDPTGADDLQYGHFRSDIYFAENQNGIWRSPEKLGEAISTPRHEVLYSFSIDGQRMYYFSGEEPNLGDLVIDTFSIYRDGAKPSSALGPFSPRDGDRDLQVFNDSVILFASQREGGFGGFDLYYSLKSGDTWSDAINLGASVNSFYDETSPFLVRNGRMLYFSSNRLTSMGGLDIYQVTFDDGTRQWGKPRNLGVPVNSAGDDSHFVPAADGLTAYFSSDRKDGYGERDLYTAYLKSVVRQHLMLSDPVTFAHYTFSEDSVAFADTTTAVIGDFKEFYIGDLQIDANDVVLTPQNIKRLDVLANLMLIYPTIETDLVCHDIPRDSRSFDLYFSIKKAEQAATYLERKGVDPNRIRVKGCGAFYPVAVSEDNFAFNPSLNRLNRRIEIEVWNTDDLPVTIIYAHPNVPEDLVNPEAFAFSDIQSNLLYRIRIASVQQMLQSKIFEAADDAMVFFDPMRKRYVYYIGMEQNYADALELRNYARKNGFGDASITAHMRGRELSREEIVSLGEEYPDVLKVLGDDN